MLEIHTLLIFGIALQAIAIYGTTYYGNMETSLIIVSIISIISYYLILKAVHLSKESGKKFEWFNYYRIVYSLILFMLVTIIIQKDVPHHKYIISTILAVVIIYMAHYDDI